MPEEIDLILGGGLSSGVRTSAWDPSTSPAPLLLLLLLYFLLHFMFLPPSLVARFTDLWPWLRLRLCVVLSAVAVLPVATALGSQAMNQPQLNDVMATVLSMQAEQARMAAMVEKLLAASNDAEK